MINRFAVRVFAILAWIFLSAGKSFADLPAPIAVPLTIDVTKNSSAQIAFVRHHTTGGGFTYLVKTMPAHGQLSAIVDDHVTYAPDNNYVGNDSFTYSVTDSIG